MRADSDTEQSWFQRFFQSHTLWEEKSEHKKASFHFHRKVEDSSEDRNDPDFVHRCENTFTFPRSVVEVKSFYGKTPSTVKTLQVNCTRHDEETNELKVSFKYQYFLIKLLATRMLPTFSSKSGNIGNYCAELN